MAKQTSKLSNLKTANTEPVDIKKKTAQQWIPLLDVKDFVAYRKDQSILGFIRIMPKNIDLFSDNELRNLIRNNTEAFSPISKHFQLICIGRPVDLSEYLEWLMTVQKNEANFLKKRLLNKIIQRNTYLASSGECKEQRYYFVMAFNDRTEKEVIQYMDELSKTFNSSDLTTATCDYNDTLDLLLLFTHPTQALVENMSFDFSHAPILDL